MVVVVVVSDGWERGHDMECNGSRRHHPGRLLRSFSHLHVEFVGGGVRSNEVLKGPPDRIAHGVELARGLVGVLRLWRDVDTVSGDMGMGSLLPLYHVYVPGSG